MITVEITFRPDDGSTQTLWADLRDDAHLRQLQEYAQAPAAANLVFPLYARLAPDGQDYPRAFRASRTTFRKL